jgi:hypothetical protein
MNHKVTIINWQSQDKSKYTTGSTKSTTTNHQRKGTTIKEVAASSCYPAEQLTEKKKSR